MVTFDTPKPTISFKRPFRPTGPNGLAWVCLTNPTIHETISSHLQKMFYDEKMGFQAEILSLAHFANWATWVNLNGLGLGAYEKYFSDFVSSYSGLG